MDTDSLIATLVSERDSYLEALNRVQARCSEQQELIRTLKTQTMGGIAKRAHHNSVAKGFWDGDQHNIPEKLALVHSEVSEALEEWRLSSKVDVYYEHGQKPLGFATELADVIVRIGDLAAYLMIDLDAVVAEKMTYNETRPAKHGKRF